MIVPGPRPVLLAAAALAVVLATWLGSIAGGRFELQRQTQQLDVDIAMRRELLRSEIERHRLLPTVLAGNPELSLAVDPAVPPDRRAELVARLNDDFARLARSDGAATLYLVDAGGVTAVASNHHLPTSFVGQNYSFRSYYRDAMRTGVGELFAQGTVSRVPGLYLAQRLTSGMGVVVAKVEFTALEANWRMQDDETLVTDGDGTVLLASSPGRRFKRYVPDVAAPAALIETRIPAAHNDWTLIVRRDIGPPMLASRIVGASIGGLLGLLAAIALLVTTASRQRRERQRAELERLVAIRTEELESSNRKLVHEIEERVRSEATVLKLREDLAQANRLAILGQISAGVAHEINQPTAAIRTYADNARRFLERGRTDEALATLSTMVSLTERIGLITDELREFSRRSPAGSEAVRLADVIDGSRLMLEQPLRMRRIALRRPNAPERQTVHANRTRLEQVLINLIQNAMDALDETASPEIRIEAGEDGEQVWIRVADNGPGVPPERRADLFAPFSSSKPLGLGLGLVICRDILSDIGGSLHFSPGPTGGAEFTARMPAWRP